MSPTGHCLFIWFSISAFWTGDCFIFGIMVAKAVLVAYGVNGADALGFAVVLHVALWLPITLLGAYFMTLEGIKWSDSLRMEKEAET